MNNRQLGLAGMLGGLAFLVIQVRHLISGVPESEGVIDRPDNVLYILWSLGTLCALWALYRNRVTGVEWLRRGAVTVPMAGFGLLAVGSLLEMMGFSNYAIAAVSWILILAGTLLVGLLTLFSPTWSGWRKFTPLLCVLIVPLAFVVGPLGALLASLPWILLGYAVFMTAFREALPGPSEIAGA